MTPVEQLRAALANVHTDRLDALRAELPTMLTSTIVGYLSAPEPLLERLEDRTLVDISRAGDDRFKLIVTAAMVAIADEIDARIPPRRSAPA